MSGQQQQQSASGAGKHRCEGRNQQEAGSSSHREAKFECHQLCDKTFKHKSRLRYHTLAHSSVTDYEWEECGKKKLPQSDLKKHTLRPKTQYVVLEIMGVKSNYECEECGKKFALKSNLTRQTQIHSGIRNYECEECGKKFPTKCDLNKHTLRHRGVRNYECEERGKKFATNYELNEHTLTHSGVRNHECEKSGKRFPIIDARNKHAFRHTGLREFKLEPDYSQGVGCTSPRFATSTPERPGHQGTAWVTY
ncbi:zinc finger protein 154-like [Scylla paramamosain]|uniref:zinc finger protein 154-like n=1 Tax=Scylla paramamosain TaxID=85552 RepID=UPI003082EC6F